MKSVMSSGDKRYLKLTITFTRVSDEQYALVFRESDRTAETWVPESLEDIKTRLSEFVALDWGDVRNGLKHGDVYEAEVLVSKETCDLLIS
jgi:hypothetical protein